MCGKFNEMNINLKEGIYFLAILFGIRRNSITAPLFLVHEVCKQQCIYAVERLGTSLLSCF